MAASPEVIPAPDNPAVVPATETAAVPALPQVQRILRWIADTRGEIDRVVRSLQSKAREKPELFLAALLVTESGTNILNASNAAENAAENAAD